MCIFVLLDSISQYQLSNHIKYFSIISCVSMGIYRCYRYSKWVYMLPLVMLCLADYYLLFTTDYSIGVMFFLIVQNSYYYLLKQRIWFHSIYIMFILSFIQLSILDIVVFVYATLSLINLYISYHHYKNTKNVKYHYLFYTIGLLALCDICVALQYLGLVVPYSSICIWIFYLPSQLFFIKSIDNSEKVEFIV